MIIDLCLKIFLETFVVPRECGFPDTMYFFVVVL